MTAKRPISKAFIILSLFALLLLGFSTSGFSTIYYVNTAADAGGDGTTQELTGEHCAFKTIAQVNAASPAAGDSVLFNKGNEWREQLTIPTSGSDGSPITYGAYGDGADPIINGADVVSTWTANSSSENIGDDSAFGVSSSYNANYIYAFSMTTNNAGTVSKISLYVQSEETSGAVKCAIYADSEGVPGSVIGNGITNEVNWNHNNEWVDFTFATDPSVTAATLYWLCVWSDVAHDQSRVVDSTYNMKFDSETYGTWPETFTNDGGHDGYGDIDFYMQVDSGITNVWQAACTTEPNQVFFDGTKGTKVASAILCNEANEWFWEASVLYVYYTEDPDGAVVIEASARAGIAIYGKDYITVDGINIKYADYHGINFRNGSDNCIIQNCTAQYNYEDGISCNDADGPAVNLVTISNSTITYNGGFGIAAGRYATNWTIEKNTVHDNCISTHVDSTAGIGAYHATSIGHIIQDNTVYYNGIGNETSGTGVGIWVDTAGAGITVRRNNVYDNDCEGIFLEKNDSGVSVYYNLVWDNGNAGIYVYGTSALPANSSTVYNNVFYSNDEAGIEVNGDSDADSCVDNTFKNNISVGNTLWDFWAHNGGENDGTNGSGNVYTYNCFGAESADFIKWGATEYSTYDTWETAYGSGTNSVEADPLMTDPANDNFHLNPHSPCVNAGTSVSLTEDYEGLKIRHAPDIGAYENQTNVLFFSWNYLRKFWK